MYTLYMWYWHTCGIMCMLYMFCAYMWYYVCALCRRDIVTCVFIVLYVVYIYVFCCTSGIDVRIVLYVGCRCMYCVVVYTGCRRMYCVVLYTGCRCMYCVVVYTGCRRMYCVLLYTGCMCIYCVVVYTECKRMYYVVLYTRYRCMCGMSGVGACIAWCCVSWVVVCV